MVSETYRTRDDALIGVRGFNAKEDRRHDRRTLDLEELRNSSRQRSEAPRFNA